MRHHAGRRGAALALALTAACVAACGSSSLPTASPTEAATPTPSPTPEAAPTPTPEPPPSLSTTAPGDLAYHAVWRYAEAMLRGQYDQAWPLLGAGSQARWGSVAAFAKDRAAFMKTAGRDYKIEPNPTNTLALGSWIIGMSWASKIDQNGAILFSLHWAGYGTDPRGTEIWIANPVTGGWELYLAN